MTNLREKWTNRWALPFALCLLATAHGWAQKAKPKFAVSANLGGLTLLDPILFDLERVQAPGTVIVRLEISPDGVVRKADIVSGDAGLRPIVLESASRWRFVRTSVPFPASQQVWIYFVEDNGIAIHLNRPLLPPPPVGAPLGSIDIHGASAAEERTIRRLIAANPGDPLSQLVWDRAKKAAREQKPPMQFQVKLGPDGLPYIRIWR